MAHDRDQSEIGLASDDLPGLLHPAPAVPAPAGDYKIYEPVEASIEDGVGHSHHGVVRERGPKLGREEEALLALEHTVITRPVAWMLTAFFLLTIFAVPVIQQAVEMQRKRADAPAGTSPGEARRLSLVPQVVNDALGEVPQWRQLRSVRSAREAWALMPAADRFKQHETNLENDAVAVQLVLPRMQSWLTRYGGVGNAQAYCGVTKPNDRRWLMYRPDVEYLTSRGFLDPALLKVRKRAGDSDTEAVQPDPVRAIVDFNNQLGAMGIRLIVMPVPVKPMLHPEKISSRYNQGTSTLQNPSYPAFRAALQRAGVMLFDATAGMLADKANTGRAQYLETDTHWTPQAMDAAARRLSAVIRDRVSLPSRTPVGYQQQRLEVGNFGDIAAMLKLPAKQKLFEPQRVTVDQVKQPDGSLWQAQPGADVLLLGDSFSNMYSSRESFPTEGSYRGRGWGEAAGFGEQISFYLKRPLDTLINNAGGSHVTREALVRLLRQDSKRFANTRLVIWEFSMRDLLSGDWKLLRLPPRRYGNSGDFTNTGVHQ
jgi:alginate O-acetyltransferase complex protein AlgJ